MIKWLESRILWGSLLIIGGVLFLFQNLGWINFGGLYWAILFGLGALFFFSVFFANKLNWWALIPGMLLLGIGIVIVLGFLAPDFSEQWGGSIVLSGVALGFGLIFLLDRQQWWAIIPGGVLFSLALAIGIENTITDLEAGGVFLLGLGITFAIVGLIPTRDGRMGWAWIPAGVLVLIGLLMNAFTGTLLPYLIPLSLIIGGGILIYITLNRKYT